MARVEHEDHRLIVVLGKSIESETADLYEAHKQLDIAWVQLAELFEMLETLLIFRVFHGETAAQSIQLVRQQGENDGDFELNSGLSCAARPTVVQIVF